MVLRFLALNYAPSITAAARPGLTFFAIQIVVAVLVYGGYADLPPSLAWLVSMPAIAMAGLLATL